MARSGIYLIIAPSGKLYVGSSVDMERRFKQHRNVLRRGVHHCRTLQDAWNKYGETLRFVEFEFCDESRLIEREQIWIDNFLALGTVLYNSSRIAGRTEMTAEIRARISAKQRGVPRKKHDDATRARMSAAQKGRIFTNEHRSKLKAPKTPEHRLKMKEAALKRWAKRIAT